MSAMNAFTSVRPRGPDLDIPAKPPRALDRLGRPTVDMGQRASSLSKTGAK